MLWLPASVGREGTAQRQHTCPRTLRALHPHFEAPRSPLDATAAQPAQAETPQRTSKARREDNPTNQQITDLFSIRQSLNSPPVQRQASRPTLLLTAPPGTRVPLHSPLWSRSTRPRLGGPGIVLLVLLLSRSGPRRSATLGRSPPFQHHDDPGCCPCAEGAAGALQKNAPASHLMPLGMAPGSFAQYDLAGHTDGTPTSPISCSCGQYDLTGHIDGTPTSPRNLRTLSHAGAPGAAADGTTGAATGAKTVVELAPRPRTLQIISSLRPHHAHHGSQPQLQAVSE